MIHTTEDKIVRIEVDGYTGNKPKVRPKDFNIHTALLSFVNSYKPKIPCFQILNNDECGEDYSHVQITYTDFPSFSLEEFKKELYTWGEDSSLRIFIEEVTRITPATADTLSNK